VKGKLTDFLANGKRFKYTPNRIYRFINFKCKIFRDVGRMAFEELLFRVFSLLKTYKELEKFYCDYIINM